MNRNNTGLLILILALLLPVCAIGTANTTTDSSPENAVLCYLNALKAGDMETAAHFSSAALPIDQWKMENP